MKTKKTLIPQVARVMAMDDDIKRDDHGRFAKADVAGTKQDPAHPDNWDKRFRYNREEAKAPDTAPFNAPAHSVGTTVRVHPSVRGIGGMEGTVHSVHEGAGIGGKGVHGYSLNIPGRNDPLVDVVGHNDISHVVSKPRA